jgi:hypothetical protein
MREDSNIHRIIILLKQRKEGNHAEWPSNFIAALMAVPTS